MADSITCHICKRTSRDPEHVRLGYCDYCNAYRVKPGTPAQRLAQISAVVVKAASDWEARNAGKPDNPKMRALAARHGLSSYYDFLMGRRRTPEPPYEVLRELPIPTD